MGHRAKSAERINQARVNDRQRKVINRLLDGFEGKLSTSKYAKLAKCSADTALRDIKNLLGHGVLIQDEGEDGIPVIVWRSLKKHLTLFNGCWPRSPNRKFCV